MAMPTKGYSFRLSQVGLRIIVDHLQVYGESEEQLP